jgi:hypothetical protein
MHVENQGGALPWKLPVEIGLLRGTGKLSVVILISSCRSLLENIGEKES